FLNVKGETGVLEAVKACWASLWTVESVYMRQQLGIGVEQAAMAVIVQVMIEADASGVIFTEGPVSSQKDCFVVNAVWGLGEGSFPALSLQICISLKGTTSRLLKKLSRSKSEPLLRTP